MFSSISETIEKKENEIEKLNKMIDFLIDEMPCIFSDCKYFYNECSPISLSVDAFICNKGIREWLEKQIREI